MVIETAKALRIVQILPELNSGGVERGTVEFAHYLTENGHDSHVISAGGRLVSQLTSEGSTHHTMPVHKKRLSSFFQIRPLQRQLELIQPDIIHVRSRIPAWLTWFALKSWKNSPKPGLVSTFHGLYSVSRYSEVMGAGAGVIAVSHYVKDYIGNNYPRIDLDKVTVIHRGVDTDRFTPEFVADDNWRNTLFSQYPQLKDKPLILMPGRLSRWKGHHQFIDLMGRLQHQGVQAHGVVVGGPTPGKEDYEAEIKQLVVDKGLAADVTFLGHRSDIQQLYSISDVVCNLSQRPEPFGRTVTEALAMNVPVVAYDEAGPGESLSACFPEGLVAKGDDVGLANTVAKLLASDHSHSIQLPHEFTLRAQAEATVDVYRQVLNGRS